jgi:hypothetical protein
MNDRVHMPMNDLFELRAHAHDWNMSTLDGVLESISKRAGLMTSLYDKLAHERGEIDELVDQLANRLKVIENDAMGHRAGSLPGIVQDVQRAHQQLSELREQIENARRTVQQIATLQIDSASLQKRNSEFSTHLREPRQELAAMRVRRHAHETWCQLNKFGLKWVDYLEYVAGLCLRHDGLDGGMCAIADALIAELVHGSRDLEALAIPGRGSRDGALTKVVYLGFPEWTVWALPLAAHELWHIARQHAQLGEQFFIFARRELGGRLSEDEIAACEEDPLLENCIADAFATYTMGPSYACAALILGLDPVSDALRASTILYTLERLVGRDQLNVDTSQTELARLWRGALEQAEHQEVERRSHLETWRDAFLAYLDKVALSNRTLRFDTRLWASVREDLKRNVVSEDGACDPDLSLRFVLSAAWEARIEQPERFGIVAERCAALCRRIKRLPPMPPRGGTTFPERPDLPN